MIELILIIHLRSNPAKFRKDSKNIIELSRRQAQMGGQTDGRGWRQYPSGPRVEG